MSRSAAFLRTIGLKRGTANCCAAIRMERAGIAVRLLMAETPRPLALPHTAFTAAEPEELRLCDRGLAWNADIVTELSFSAAEQA